MISYFTDIVNIRNEQTMKRLFSDAQAKKIRTLHHEGMTVAELIRRFMPHANPHHTTPMMNLLKGITYADAGGELGIVKHKKEKVEPKLKLTKAQKDEIIRLYGLGMNGITQGELARRYNVSPSYVNRVVNGSR